MFLLQTYDDGRYNPVFMHARKEGWYTIDRSSNKDELLKRRWELRQQNFMIPILGLRVVEEGKEEIEILS